MDLFRDIIQIGFTPVMLLIILGYQYYRIKHLKKQLDAHDKLLTSIQTYFNILNPEMLQYRVEMYEKILEKEKKIDVEKIEAKLLEKTHSVKVSQRFVAKILNSAVKTIVDCFMLIPHTERVRIANKVENDLLRNVIEGELPSYKEFDEEINMKMMIRFLAGEKKNT